MHTHNIRVRYAETDQMGVVYHGRYADYAEEARSALLRSVGFTYRELEEQGYILPVVSFHVEYKKPARYDDVITCKTYVKGQPGRLVCFITEFYLNDTHLSTAEVKLLCLEAKTMKTKPLPSFIEEAVAPFIEPA